MKKQYSLKSKIEFNKIINKGYKLRSKYLLISYKKNQNNFKIGISIPKKYGNAVFRNHNKRIIKNIIPMLNIYNMKIHIIIIAKKSFINLSFDDKKIALKEVFKNLK